MPPPAGQIRPLRYLAAFAGLVVVLYALVFLTGNAAPKLGIDLQGGTRVTLTARTENGNPPAADQLNQARQIIDQRVNGLGVAGAEVVQNGNNLVITVPGNQGDQAKSLGETARLRFRPVQQGPVPAGPTATPAPAAPPAVGGASASPRAPASPAPSSPAPSSAAPSRPAPSRPVPQGMGGSAPVVPQQAAAPTTGGSPAPTSGAPPPPAPAAPGQQPPSPANPQVAAEIAQARQVRQSTDPAVQAKALAALSCTGKDPLRGYDDPSLPLVACSQDNQSKYVLGPTIVEGTDIANANASQNPNGPGYVVNLDLKGSGSSTWCSYTTSHVGDAVAFALDGQVVSAPTVNQPICGPTQVSGNFSLAQAQNLAGVLRYGSLPLSFDTSQAQTVSATLGLDSLRAGLVAGGIGLALVFVYCLFYYRALGILTILSLVLSGVLVYAVLVLLGRSIGFTLDLAGIAGFIVAIGITADSFVVFFERLKDEVREGRTFRSAVPRGWVRARRTILSADAVSFLASAVLYILAVGDVRGFAFTLGMSTVLDLVVVFLVTHPLVVLASKSRRLSSPAYSGLGAVQRIGAARRAAAAAGERGA